MVTERQRLDTLTHPWSADAASDLLGLARRVTHQNGLIDDLLKDICAPVSPDVADYWIGGGSWRQRSDHDFDVSRRRSAIGELRTILLERIGAYESRVRMDDERRALLKELSVALRRSDLALIQTASLVGLTGRNGLFEKIREILAHDK